MYVDLPPMLGPVMMWKVESGDRSSVELGINLAPEASETSSASTQGWRPSSMRMARGVASRGSNVGLQKTAGASENTVARVAKMSSSVTTSVISSKGEVYPSATSTRRVARWA